MVVKREEIKNSYSHRETARLDCGNGNSLFSSIQLLFVHLFLEEFDINGDEIIALVQGTAEEACDSNDDLYLLPVSNKTALESVENILSYLQQQNDFSIDVP